MRKNIIGSALAVCAAIVTLAGPAQARDPGINQPGVRGGTAGIGAPGAGVADPGINQPGAIGNVGRAPGRRVVATSTYVNALPGPCSTVTVAGTTLQQCGATYYQRSGSRYVVVKVE